ncbi:DNA recombination protein RmuC [Thiogranum longum]|uniref:DNA recombination protein RmuC n=1 Tax=Thiogranum longum TaxID=1537524 RepID=A0A4R1HBT2_9GAMM|nr:DNA recombination protein RmuC [Thiogranum longum]TCK18061.1 DNA recombination protein RmuC [Thiogranum longum]
MEITWIIVLLSALLAGLVGWLAASMRAQRKLSALKEENVRVTAQLESERRVMEEKLRSFETARTQLEDSFKALAGDIMKSSSSEFLKLAETRFRALHEQSSNEFDKREKAVENLVKPIRETLDKTDQQIRKMEEERQKSFGALNQHLEFMKSAHDQLQNETRNLVKALKRPEVRGQWGELTLKRLAELAGMVEHCDFKQQHSIDSEEGKQRPDMIVRMPGGREVVVDAKAPMDAYLCAVEAEDDVTRAQELQRHARNVRARVRELASKAYWQNLSSSLDFVVLFIPGDQFLSAALELDATLLEDALTDRVVLATPSSLVALLRAIAYGWRQESLAENAEQIRTVGEELYERLSTFAGHLDKLGSALGNSVKHYNSAVGSFDSRILPSARRFNEMGIRGKKEITEAAPVERLPRDVRDSEIADKPPDETH